MSTPRKVLAVFLSFILAFGLSPFAKVDRAYAQGVKAASITTQEVSSDESTDAPADEGGAYLKGIVSSSWQFDSDTNTYRSLNVKYSPENASIGRTGSNWWVGGEVYAPASISSQYPNESLKGKTEVAKYRSNAGSVRYFGDAYDYMKDGRYVMTFWLPVKQEYLQNAVKKGSNLLLWTYEFDWDGNGTWDDTFKVYADTKNVTLLKEDGTSIECQTKDGKFTYKDGKQFVPVAKCKNEQYASLQEAVDAAAKVEGSEGEDISLIANAVENVVIPKGANISLDLGKYTLTNDTTNGTKADTITVEQGAVLSIDSDADDDETPLGVVDNVSHARAALFNNGETYVEGGKFTRSKENGSDAENNGGNSYYTVLNHGKMVLWGGVIQQNGGYSSLLENGYKNYSSADPRAGYVNGVNDEHPYLDIDGAVLDGGLNTIKNDDGAKLAVVDGEFKNIHQHVLMNWNEAEIEGGTFTMAQEATTAVIANNYQAGGNDKGQLAITGGTFNAASPSAPCISTRGDSSADEGCGVLTIANGEDEGQPVFSGTMPTSLAKGHSLVVTGGKFTDESVSKYVPADYEATKGDDDTLYVVSEKATVKQAKESKETFEAEYKAEPEGHVTWDTLFDAMLSYDEIKATDSDVARSLKEYYKTITSIDLSGEDIEQSKYGKSTFVGRDAGSLANLVNLETVNLSKTKIADKEGGAAALGVFADTGEGGAVKAHFANLQYLDVSGNTGVKDIGALRNSSQLTHLDLSGTGVADLGVLQYATGVTELNVSGTAIEGLGALEHTPKLTALDISNTKVTDLNVLYLKETNYFKDLANLTATGLDLTSIAGVVMVASTEGFKAEGKNWDLSGSYLSGNDATDHVQQAAAKLEGGTFKAPTILVETPTVTKESFTYDGQEKTALERGIGYKVEGGSATVVGEYTAQATPESGYAWSDKSTDAASYKWLITKADNPIEYAAADKLPDLFAGGKIEGTAAYKVVKAGEGDVSFAKKDGYDKINVADDGAITVAGDAEPGDYKVKVAATAAGNDNYSGGTSEFEVTVKVIGAVAKIGDTPYASLQAALAAANSGETVELQADTTLAQCVDVNLAADASVVVDLGGKTVYPTAACANGSAFDVVSGAVTIQNGKIDGSAIKDADIASGECDAITVRSGGVAKLADGLEVVVNSKNGACVYPFAGGKVEIAGGVYKNLTTEAYQYKPEWKGMVVNQANVEEQLISITGGDFHGVDPALGDDAGKMASFLAEGYYSEQVEGGYFKVAEMVEQEINVEASIQKTFGDGPFDLGATAQGELTYAPDDSGVVSVDEAGKVTILKAGEAKITVSAAASGKYLPAEKAVTVTVSKADGTLTADTESVDLAINGEPAVVTLSGVLGEVTVTSSNETKATVSVEGPKVTITPVAATAEDAPVSITITDAGDDNHNSKSITVTVAVKKAAGTLQVTSDVEKSVGYKAESTVFGPSDLFTISGQHGELKFKKTMGSEGIDVAEDGTVTVEATLEPGTYRVCVEVTDPGDSEYAASVVKDVMFNIKVSYVKGTFKDAVVVLEESKVTYTGSETGFEAKVSSVTLYGKSVSGDFWTQNEFDAQINAGSYPVTVTGKGEPFDGETATTMFTIDRKDLSEGSPEIECSPNNDQIYTGSEIEFDENFKITYHGGVGLERDKDYSIGYANNTNVGDKTATAKIMGFGNYKGSRTIKFSIVNASIANNCTVAPIEAQSYTGSALKPALTVTNNTSGVVLVPGVDYVAAYANNTGSEKESSLADVTVVGIGNYASDKDEDSVSKQFVITPSLKDLSTGSIASITAQKWTGSAIEPTVTVKDESGNELKKDENYTVEYKDNTDRGTATVTVKGAGEYVGTLTTTFEIYGNVSKNLAEATIEAADMPYTGMPITPEVTIEFSDGTTLLPGEFTVEVEGEAKEPDTYTAKIVPNGEAGVTDSSEDEYETVEFTVVPASMDLSIVEGIVDKDYTGADIKQAVVVKNSIGTVLDENEDYVLNYENNKSVGTATVQIAGTGEHYTGAIARTFEINATTFAKAKVQATVDNTQTTYAGEALKPVVLTAGEGEDVVTLAEGVDYTVIYQNNVNAGEAKAIIIGQGAFFGSTMTKKFTINPAKVSVPTAKPGLVYTGAEQVGVEPGTGYTLEGNAEINASDSYTATAKLANVGEQVNYIWDVDDDADKVTDKSIPWSIGKASRTVTLGSNAKTGTYAYNRTIVIGAEVSAGDGSIEYSSSNTSVATVDALGSVKMVSGKGSAIITASVPETVNYKAASETFKVTASKLANPLEVKAATGSVKFTAIKKKAAKITPKVVKTTGQGTLTYTIKSVTGKKTKAKNKAKFKLLNKNTGQIQVAAKTPKDVYTITLTVKANGNDNFAASKVLTPKYTVTIK